MQSSSPNIHRGRCLLARSRGLSRRRHGLSFRQHGRLALDEPSFLPGARPVNPPAPFNPQSRCIPNRVSDPRLGFPRLLKIVMLLPPRPGRLRDIAAGLMAESNTELLSPGRSRLSRRSRLRNRWRCGRSTLASSWATRFSHPSPTLVQQKTPSAASPHRALSST